MAKKSKVLKLIDATDMAKNDKNPGSSTETLINGLEHRVPDPVISKKSSNTKSVYLRRSWRLQSVIKPAVQNQEIEQISLLESEKEDEPFVEDDVHHPSLALEPHNNDGPAINHKTLDEKVDDLMKAVAESEPKGAKEHDLCESSLVSLIYKSLYFDSQKKVEALTLENRELARKLEIALGKLEVYESINNSTKSGIIPNVVKGGGGGGGGGGDDDVDGGGTVAKKPSTKKRRQAKN